MSSSKWCNIHHSMRSAQEKPVAVIVNEATKQIDSITTRLIRTKVWTSTANIVEFIALSMRDVISYE